jgi:hypothetical protein
LKTLIYNIKELSEGDPIWVPVVPLKRSLYGSGEFLFVFPRTFLPCKILLVFSLDKSAISIYRVDILSIRLTGITPYILSVLHPVQHPVKQI